MKMTMMMMIMMMIIDNYDDDDDTPQVNPVTGCEEKPGPSPLDGMSEEQKE